MHAVLMIISAVSALPLNNVMKTLYEGEDLTRSRREFQEVDMCSYRMQNITRLAETAGQIFVSHDFKSNLLIGQNYQPITCFLDDGRRFPALSKNTKPCFLCKLGTAWYLSTLHITSTCFFLLRKKKTKKYF